MNWYLKNKKAMALEPESYKEDPTPHRQQRHQDALNVPWGRIVQKQDREEIDREYSGVHLTDSIEMAGIYANNKSTQEDPPVIIEIYKDGLEGIPDIDSKSKAPMVSDFVMDNISAIEDILNDEDFDSGNKLDMIEDLFEDVFNEGDGDTQDPIDVVNEKETSSVERAIISYMKSFPDPDSALNEMKSILSGSIPDKLLMIIANQFRVMTPIGSDRVHAIYQMRRVNLEEFYYHAYDGMNEEELKEQLEEDGLGFELVDGEILDDDLRTLVDYEDIDHGHWLEYWPIYQSTQNVNSNDFTYHGTTLSRAKSAYPELLP